MLFEPQVKHMHCPLWRFSGVFTSSGFLQDSACSATDTAKFLFLACTGFEYLKLLSEFAVVQSFDSLYTYVRACRLVSFLGITLHHLAAALTHSSPTLTARSVHTTSIVNVNSKIIMYPRSQSTTYVPHRSAHAL